jgi:nitroreductase
METNREQFLEFIKSRRSVRNFIFEDIKEETVKKILECGRWAPSGLNNQPWFVCVAKHPTVKKMLADATKYSGIIESAYYCIVIFLDLEKGYHRVKDIQAMGAFMENLLLGAHALKVGAVWIGEILNKKEEVTKIFKLGPDKFELMGVIALGAIDEKMHAKKGGQRERRPIEDFCEWF